jgi:hypothetical protein
MTISWAPTFGECATRAYRILGYLEDPWVPTDDQKAQAEFAGNGLLKGWGAMGANLFRQERRTLTVAAQTAQIDVDPMIMGIEQASWVVQGGSNPYHRPMGQFSYVDYYNLPNPNSNSTSGPSVYMFNRQDTTSSLYIWPLATLGGQIVATVVRTVEDVDWDTRVDFPSEWNECFVYNLADRLMDDQGVAASDPQTAQRITAHAAILLQRQLDFDRPSSIWSRPAGRSGSGPLYRQR